MSDYPNEAISQLSDALASLGVDHEYVERDIFITGAYLSELLEFCQQWRSEIEEMG